MFKRLVGVGVSCWVRQAEEQKIGEEASLYVQGGSELYTHIYTHIYQLYIIQTSSMYR